MRWGRGGGGTIRDSIMGEHKTLFLTKSIFFKILGGGGVARAPYSAVPVHFLAIFLIYNPKVYMKSSLNENQIESLTAGM